MQCPTKTLWLLVTILLTTWTLGSANAQAVIVEHLNFGTNAATGVKPAMVVATLYLPRETKPVSVMVIVSSSGGVLDYIEGYYARELSNRGVAALIVDSFNPRSVRKTIEDQSLVSSWDMENDAFAALNILRNDRRIDANHIGIMGLSKGGGVAQNAALSGRGRWRGTGDLVFAAHVAIAPDCVAQPRNPRTTGRPILYMLAELDDATPARSCVEYAERLRAAGNAGIVVKSHKGANHNWEDTRAVSFLAKAENFSHCPAVIEDDGAWVMAGGRGPIFRRPEDVFAWRRTNCRILGYHVGGGNETLKREAIGEIIQFLHGSGFSTGG